MITIGTSTQADRAMRQPPPVIILPILRCLPLFVHGILVVLDMRLLILVMPIARFQENPPNPIILILFKSLVKK